MPLIRKPKVIYGGRSATLESTILVRHEQYVRKGLKIRMLVGLHEFMNRTPRSCTLSDQKPVLA